MWTTGLRGGRGGGLSPSNAAASSSKGSAYSSDSSLYSSSEYEAKLSSETRRGRGAEEQERDRSLGAEAGRRDAEEAADTAEEVVQLLAVRDTGRR